ncbi:MAG: hypothetical protein M5U34_32335 [Chloroflexi bacterium]|nr:hypothetical protein [Chloroflexota bacterium]
MLFRTTLRCPSSVTHSTISDIYLPSESSSRLTTRLPDYPTIRLLDYPTTRLPDYPTTRLPDYSTTRLLD